MAESRLSRAALEEWLADRRTRAFLQWLRDQSQMISDQWGRGQTMGSEQQVKALLFREISTLNWRDLLKGYEALDEWTAEAAKMDAPPAEDDEESGAQ
jgi:hypothetical protein